jgi:S-adenosylmethionine hydrolase
MAIHFAETDRGQPLAYWGSAGFLELAVREGSAADQYSLHLRDTVKIVQRL